MAVRRESIPTKIKIRPMIRSDVSRVSLLETEIFPDPWPEQAFLEELDRDDRGVILAEIDGRLAGYAAYIIGYGEGHLTNIAVHHEYRGKSVAKKLLNLSLIHI